MEHINDISANKENFCIGNINHAKSLWYSCHID